MYAAGKIPGGFFKREGRPTEKAILTARMIDRPIRPLWPKGYKNEVQVICTVLSADLVTPHDILCINAASAALMLSPMPFLGPVGAVRIGRLDGELVVNPTLQETESESSLDLIVVGTKDGLTMVEAGAEEVPGREGQVARPRARGRARARARALDLGADPEGRPPRGGHGRARTDRAARPAAFDGLDRGGHHPADPGRVRAEHAPRQAAARRRRGPGS
jgi:hypothetical protein